MRAFGITATFMAINLNAYRDAMTEFSPFITLAQNAVAEGEAMIQAVKKRFASDDARSFLTFAYLNVLSNDPCNYRITRNLTSSCKDFTRMIFFRK